MAQDIYCLYNITPHLARWISLVSMCQCSVHLRRWKTSSVRTLKPPLAWYQNCSPSSCWETLMPKQVQIATPGQTASGTSTLERWTTVAGICWSSAPTKNSASPTHSCNTKPHYWVSWRHPSSGHWNQLDLGHHQMSSSAQCASPTKLPQCWLWYWPLYGDHQGMPTVQEDPPDQATHMASHQLCQDSWPSTLCTVCWLHWMDHQHILVTHSHIIECLRLLSSGHWTLSDLIWKPNTGSVCGGQVELHSGHYPQHGHVFTDRK